MTDSPMTYSLRTTGEGQASPGRRERRRLQTRERIFRAAMQLFAVRGFFATTVEDITEAADVGKGTFFNYFPSKEHVLTVLHEIQLGKVSGALEQASAGKHSVQEILHQLARRVVEEPGRSQPLARGLIATLLSNDVVRDAMGGTMMRGRDLLAKILAIGRKRGEIRTDISLEEMAGAFQQCLLGTVLIWSIRPQDNLKKHVDVAFKIFWSGASTPTSGVKR